jgi:hypothetical protein
VSGATVSTSRVITSAAFIRDPSVGGYVNVAARREAATDSRRLQNVEAATDSRRLQNVEAATVSRRQVNGKAATVSRRQVNGKAATVSRRCVEESGDC